MRKRIAVMGVSAALVLGSATVAMAAGGNGPGTNLACTGDCTGQQVRLQQDARVAGTGDLEQIREQIQNRFQDPSAGQAMEQLRTQTQSQVHEPAGDQGLTRTRAENQAVNPAGDQNRTRSQEMIQSGDCDGTGGQVQARDHAPDGSSGSNGLNGGNANRSGGGNGNGK